jgi:AcrR family transcriptional regulator
MENPAERPMSEYLHQIPVEQVTAKKRWTRDDWIVFGLDVLEKDGLAAVRIEELARRGQRTPGSFYAHFKTRDELLEAMLDAWLEFKVENSMRIDSQLFHTGKFALESLVTRLIGGGFQLARIHLELAIRDWALKDERARKAVMQVDSTRLTNSTAMLRAEFPNAAHPQVFPLLFVWMLCGRNLVFVDPKNKALLDSVDIAAAAFVQMYQSTAGKFQVPSGPTWVPSFEPRPDNAAPALYGQEMDFNAPSAPKTVTQKRRRRR